MAINNSRKDFKTLSSPCYQEYFHHDLDAIPEHEEGFKCGHQHVYHTSDQLFSTSSQAAHLRCEQWRRVCDKVLNTNSKSHPALFDYPRRHRVQLDGNGADAASNSGNDSLHVPGEYPKELSEFDYDYDAAEHKNDDPLCAGSVRTSRGSSYNGCHFTYEPKTPFAIDASILVDYAYASMRVEHRSQGPPSARVWRTSFGPSHAEKARESPLADYSHTSFDSGYACLGLGCRCRGPPLASFPQTPFKSDLDCKYRGPPFASFSRTSFVSSLNHKSKGPPSASLPQSSSESDADRVDQDASSDSFSQTLFESNSAPKDRSSSLASFPRTCLNFNSDHKDRPRSASLAPTSFEHGSSKRNCDLPTADYAHTTFNSGHVQHSDGTPSVVGSRTSVESDDEHSPDNRREHVFGAEDALPNTNTDAFEAGKTATPTSPETNTRAPSEDSPDIVWPPRGYHKDYRMNGQEVQALVSDGAALYSGGSVDDRRTNQTGELIFYGETTSQQNMLDITGFCPTASFTLGPSFDHPCAPWETLEQPSMLLKFTTYRGAISFSYWIMSSKSEPALYVPQAPRVIARGFQINFNWMLSRIVFLQKSMDYDMFQRHATLYERLISTKHLKLSSMEEDLFDQITDLVDVLDTPDWIDFSQLKNQAMAIYLAVPPSNMAPSFLKQLLLSLELYRRLELMPIEELQKRDILAKLPRTVAYDVVLADMWIKGVRFEYDNIGGGTQSSTHLINRDGQLSRLHKFATTVDWPSLSPIESYIRASPKQKKFWEISNKAALSWASNVVLPGPLSSWLLMLTIVGMDSLIASQLSGLDQMLPNSGFQHRGRSYWFADCIVGKVIAPCHGVISCAGWITHCPASVTLATTQYVAVKQIETPHIICQRKIDSIATRSFPTGPPDSSFPIYEYCLPMLKANGSDNLHVMLQDLAFRPAAPDTDEASPALHEAAMIFGMPDDNSITLPLLHNVSFISAAACERSPHPLYYRFGYQQVSLTELIEMEGWDGNSAAASGSPLAQQEILVIEALGDADCEVLARAWCAKMAHSAIVADLYATCFACAVRAAFAACVEVVILTNHMGRDEDEGDEEEEELGRDADGEPWSRFHQGCRAEGVNSGAS